MTAKHTPGPWHIEHGHRQIINGITYWQVTDGQDAICCNQFCYAGDSEANARLIAAAPELLAAARKALNYIENTEGELGIALSSGDELRAAIAKAEGR